MKASTGTRARPRPWLRAMARAAAVAADTSAAPSDAGRAHPRPWLRAMGRAAAVAADINGTDHCLGPLVLQH
jgi:hypothetical protein